jgi:hypothetical protein
MLIVLAVLARLTLRKTKIRVLLSWLNLANDVFYLIGSSVLRCVE